MKWREWIYITLCFTFLSVVVGVSVGKYYKEGLIEAELLVCQDPTCECFCEGPKPDCWEYFEWQEILRELREEDTGRTISFHVFDDGNGPNDIHIELVAMRGNASYKWKFRAYEEFYEWYYNDYKLSH